MNKIIPILMLSVFAFTSAFAGNYDLKEITPEVQKSLDGRRDRFNLLENLKNEGAIGEDRDGFVKNLTGNAESASIIKAENKDRNTIYNAILKQNNLPETEIHTVRRVFAETQRNKAKQGQMIQTESGAWIKK